MQELKWYPAVGKDECEIQPIKDASFLLQNRASRRESVLL
jgi:hypothetical protein